VGVESGGDERLESDADTLGRHVGMEDTDEAVALGATHAFVHRRSREAEPLGQVSVDLAPILLKGDE